MLTAVQLRNARPRKAPYKVADGGGMYLLVNPSGSKLWRLKFRVGGVEKTLALGIYHDADGQEQVSLKEARDARDAAKRLLREGKDPSAVKAAEKREQKQAAGSSFEAVAREWFAQYRTARKLAPVTANGIQKSLEANLFPSLGKRPIKAIEAPEVLEALRKIEARGAHDVRSRAQRYALLIFGYAIGRGFCTRNPVADIAGAFTAVTSANHARLKEEELPEFYERLGKFVEQGGARRTELALRLLILTLVRTTELRAAKWSEFDLEGAVWVIPGERMKKARDQEPRDHIVPLSTQALAILAELRGLAGASDYVFPHAHNDRKTMSENTMLYALYRLGYHSKATGHGWRITASTILHEARFRTEVIEKQLAHVDRNKVRGIYNKALYLPERTELMQAWADMVDHYEKPQSKIVAGKFGKRAKA